MTKASPHAESHARLSRRSWGLEAWPRAMGAVPTSLVERIARRLAAPRFGYLPEGLSFVVSLATGIHRESKRKSPRVAGVFARNLFVNAFVKSGAARDRVRERTGGYAPELMVVSPTMRCNLKCKGCYSARYATSDELTTEELDDLFRQAKGMGIYFVVVSGGEPYLREDLLDLFARHDDMLFMTYTNGTLLGRADRAAQLARLGNVVPCISVEGFEAETDARRGKGVFGQIMGAMDALRDAGVYYGFSATPTRANNELVVSDEFVDFYVEKGCFLGWYFSYMPVGRDPDLGLMPTPEQREYRRRRIISLRRRKKLILADFWCDGPLVGNCLSGGKVYFHVNSRGGVEPCVFNQFAVDNIRSKPLVEIIDSPYFRYIRGRLSEIDNPLRPCPIIDRPQILRDIVAKFHPTPSQQGGEATITRLAGELNRYARELQALMDPVWEREYGGRREVGTDFHIERAADAPVRLAQLRTSGRAGA